MKSYVYSDIRTVCLQFPFILFQYVFNSVRLPQSKFPVKIITVFHLHTIANKLLFYIFKLKKKKNFLSVQLPQKFKIIFPVITNLKIYLLLELFLENTFYFLISRTDSYFILFIWFILLLISLHKIYFRLSKNFL